MSLQSWLDDRERWDAAQRQTQARYTSNGHCVFDEKGAELATCRDERTAAVLATLLGAVRNPFSRRDI